MKPSSTNPVAAGQPPVFPQTPHRLRPDPGVAAKKSNKRENIFSKPHDTHEDRGTREMKMSQTPRSFQFAP
jgi:hypothetical protein